MFRKGNGAAKKLLTACVLCIAGLTFAQKAAPKPAPAAPAMTAPAEPEVEYEEIWLPIGAINDYPTGSRAGKVFPTGDKFQPKPGTPLRVKTRKHGKKVGVKLEGLPLHSGYYVKPRSGTWPFAIDKGDVVERMIRRPKPVQPQPEVVEKVDAEEKKEIEKEAQPAEIETVKDNTVIATQIQETEKVSEEFSRPFHERMFGVSVNYTNNYTEHYAQYFTLPSSGLIMRGDFYVRPLGGRFYFDYLASGSGNDVPAGSTYKNPNFWKAGYSGRYFGAHYKSQTTANPAGILLRDIMSSELGLNARYGFNITDHGWLSMGSNLLLFWYTNPTQTTTTSTSSFSALINLTADFDYAIYRYRGFLEAFLTTGTAFTIGDGTGMGYDATGTWNNTAGSANTAASRAFRFAGFRVGTTIYFYLLDGFRIKGDIDWYPVLNSAYARYTNLNRDTSTSMFVFTVGGEFRL